MRDADEIKHEPDHYALWLEGQNLLVCAFRLCNFSKARFAPGRYWTELIKGIIAWLGGSIEAQSIEKCFRDEYGLYEKRDPAAAAGRAIDWFKKADMLIPVDGTP